MLITRRLARDTNGATMAEYALLVGLIALVVALGATILGQDISTMFNNIGTYIQSLVPPGVTMSPRMVLVATRLCSSRLLCWPFAEIARSS